MRQLSLEWNLCPDFGKSPKDQKILGLVAEKLPTGLEFSGSNPIKFKFEREEIETNV